MSGLCAPYYNIIILFSRIILYYVNDKMLTCWHATRNRLASIIIIRRTWKRVIHSGMNLYFSFILYTRAALCVGTKGFVIFFFFLCATGNIFILIFRVTLITLLRPLISKMCKRAKQCRRLPAVKKGGQRK